MTHDTAKDMTIPSSAESSVSKRPHVLGIDIGGTKLAVGIADELGALVFSERIPSNATQAAEPTLARLVDLCRRAIAESGVPVVAAGGGCGGAPGPKKGEVMHPRKTPR